MWLDFPNVTRCLVTNGNKVDVDPYPNADTQSVRLYTLGSAMAAVLHQNGYLVLHAKAISVGNACIAFIGPSRAGKSTMAALFQQAGFQVITDDILAINKNKIPSGGFPQIKLWRDSLEQLNINENGLNRVRSNLEKFSLPITSHEDEPSPIKAIYLLSPDDQVRDSIQISELRGVEKFAALKTEHISQRNG